jgi:hypothetical protein
MPPNSAAHRTKIPLPRVATLVQRATGAGALGRASRGR